MYKVLKDEHGKVIAEMFDNKNVCIASNWRTGKMVTMLKDGADKRFVSIWDRLFADNVPLRNKY